MFKKCSAKKDFLKTHNCFCMLFCCLIWQSIPCFRLFNLASLHCGSMWGLSQKHWIPFSEIIGQPTFRYLWPTFWSHPCFSNTAVELCFCVPSLLIRVGSAVILQVPTDICTILLSSLTFTKNIYHLKPVYY